MAGELSLQDQKKILIDQLRFLAKKKGFITFEDILSNDLAAILSIDELDRVNETLLDLGIIIRAADEDPVDEDFEDIVDRSHIDYEEVFRRVIKIDPSLKPYISDIRRIIPPRTNEENLLVLQALEGNKFARERLIAMFLKVVVRMALWFHKKYSLSLGDSIQDGNVGLVLAIDKFAHQNNNRFSTYAPWWIRQQMGRYAQYRFDALFYFPTHVKDKLLRIYEIKRTIYCAECDGIYTCPNIVDHISTELAVDSKTAEKYLAYFNPPISIEQTLTSFEEQIIFSDYGKLVDQINEKIDSYERQKIIDILFDGLRDREIGIIQKRYGFCDEHPMSLEEISHIYGLTRERIRQIEQNAKTKMLKKYSRINLI